jgi:hypothetical protein
MLAGRAVVAAARCAQIAQVLHLLIVCYEVERLGDNGAADMPPSSKQSVAHGRPDEQLVREQEVLRATRELAAYFKGRRTEREARAAIKIIKAFIRDRERIDPAKRRPLPGVQSTSEPIHPRKHTEAGARNAPRRNAPRTDGPAAASSDTGPLPIPAAERSSNDD